MLKDIYKFGKLTFEVQANVHGIVVHIVRPAVVYITISSFYISFSSL